jgi:TctA family transporter
MHAMEADMLHAAGSALLIILDPHRLIYLFAGVCMGLGLGLLPGIGGIAGTALMLPFTYQLDAHAAFALLLGLGATTTTADPISAILFGVPGHAASAATTLDGYPLTRKGEAGRALGASYMSALMGGLFGAALMGVSLPILRPLMLYVGSPELLALAVFGISMVAALSGNAPLRGLTAACLGIMLSMVGEEAQSGQERWTLDTLYLADGLPLVPLVLGIFALPELCDLSIARTAVVPEGRAIDAKTGMLLGVKDCFTHWFLILRCSWIGSVMGAIPGIAVSIIDWISYAHALRTEKGAHNTFGTGDIRGVIAAESATNAREGGALVPTVAFGVPTSAGMAILLGAFLIHGLVPGPDMLGKNLDVTYAMVWSIAIANILGSGLCFLFSGQFAKLATLRYTLIMPAVLSLVYIGAFEGRRQWGDFFALLAFGLLGWAMKHCKWPRPPLVLGFILGTVIERYLFISIQRYGAGWMLRPVVIAMFVLSVLGLLRSFVEDVRTHGGISGMVSGFGAARFQPTNLLPTALLLLVATMLAQSLDWSFEAKIVPMIVGGLALLFGMSTLGNEVFRRPRAAPRGDAGTASLLPPPNRNRLLPISISSLMGRNPRIRGFGWGRVGVEGRAVGHGGAASLDPHPQPLPTRGRGETTQKIHMDIESRISHLPTALKLARGALFFGWMAAFLGAMAMIGLIATVPIFIIAYMRLEGRERWSLTLPMAATMTLFIYGLFDRLLAIPWPPSLLGTALPVLKAIPGM